MTNCIICGKKLRAFKTTREWRNRNVHLNCQPKKKKKEQRRLKYFIEQYKMMCQYDDWDYDYETNKIIDKRITI